MKHRRNHSNDVAPNYDVVFRTDAVNTLTITIAPDALQAKIRAHAEMIAPVATQHMSQDEYAAAVQTIVDYVERSAKDVEDFLAKQK